MKQIIFSVFTALMLINCNVKKDSKTPVENDKKLLVVSHENSIDEDDKELDSILTNDVTTKNSKANQELLDPTKGLIVVFKDYATETKDLIFEKGITFEKMLFDKKSLHVGLIRVPADQKDFWLNTLIETGRFRDVKLYTEKNLEKLLAKEKANSRK